MLKQQNGRQYITNPKIQAPDPEHIFHYTSNSVFLKICATKSLRLTHYKCLNDFKEGETEVKELQEFAQKSSKTKKRTDDGLQSDAYVMCFSEKPDMLSQWRAYGDGGHGVCIGFNLKKLRAALKLQSYLFISRIQYDGEPHAAFATVLAGLKKVSQAQANRTAKSGEINFFHTAIKIPLFHKAPEFSEEREWRIVARGDRKTALSETTLLENIAEVFFDRGAYVVPALDIHLPAFIQAIETIVVGPKNTSIPEHIQRATGRNSVNISASNITYR